MMMKPNSNPQIRRSRGPLTDDICRCHDGGCPERESCLRWIDRHEGGPRVVAAGSLYPYDQPLGQPCTNHIPPSWAEPQEVPCE